MHEEMVSARESCNAKGEHGLFRIWSAGTPPEDLDDEIAALARCASRNDLAAAMQAVHRLAPEFEPSDMLVELLDSLHPRVATA